MKLFILRHGKAEEGAYDPDRRLVERGREDVLDVATRFAARGETLDRCFSSPYVRARQSAEAFLEGSASDCSITCSDLLTPDQRASDLLPFLNKLDAGNVLLVGHNPLLSKLCGLLLEGAGHPYQVRALGTSDLCCIRCEIAGPGMGVEEFLLTPRR